MPDILRPILFAVLTLLAAVIAMLGEPRKAGRFTRVGCGLLLVSVLACLLAVAFTVHDARARRSARLSFLQDVQHRLESAEKARNLLLVDDMKSEYVPLPVTVPLSPQDPEMRKLQAEIMAVHWALRLGERLDQKKALNVLPAAVSDELSNAKQEIQLAEPRRRVAVLTNFLLTYTAIGGAPPQSLVGEIDSLLSTPSFSQMERTVEWALLLVDRAERLLFSCQPTGAAIACSTAAAACAGVLQGSSSSADGPAKERAQEAWLRANRFWIDAVRATSSDEVALKRFGSHIRGVLKDRPIAPIGVLRSAEAITSERARLTLKFGSLLLATGKADSANLVYESYLYEYWPRTRDTGLDRKFYSYALALSGQALCATGAFGRADARITQAEEAFADDKESWFYRTTGRIRSIYYVSKCRAEGMTTEERSRAWAHLTKNLEELIRGGDCREIGKARRKYAEWLELQGQPAPAAFERELADSLGISHGEES